MSSLSQRISDLTTRVATEIKSLWTSVNSKLAASSYTAADVLSKIKTVDGTGSGLDADLVDGQHGQYWADYRFSGSTAANLDLCYDGGVFNWNTSTLNTPVSSSYGTVLNFVSSGINHNNTNNWLNQLGITTAGVFYWRQKINGGGWTSWRKLWDSNNDGSGSGLDADLLDGQHASAFLTAITKAMVEAVLTGTITSHVHNRIPSKGTLSFTETGRTTIETGIYTYNVNSASLGDGTPTAYWSVFGFGAGTSGMGEFAVTWTSSGLYLYFRSLRDTIDNWWPWKQIYHSGNFDPATKADLASPALTGTPTAPTQSSSDNSTRIATTAFVKAVGYITGITKSMVEAVLTGVITSHSHNDLPLAGGILSGKIGRSAHNVGHLEGSYNNVGNNSSKTNPIYTIGSSYNPNDADLGNMYGIGYTRTDATFLNSTDLGIGPIAGWGMYIASDGNARIFLNADGGHIYALGNIYSGGQIVVKTNDSRLSDSRPASDVYTWAKASTKPSYTYSEVGAEAAFNKNSAFNKNFGSTSGTVTQGNDSRLSDARTPTDSSVTYGKVSNTLKTYASLSSGSVDLSANGGGKITLSADTAFSFSNYELGKTYRLIIVANGHTPSFATAARHDIVDGSATFGTSGTFYVGLECIDATSGSELLLTTIMQGGG